MSSKDGIDLRILYMMIFISGRLFTERRGRMIRTVRMTEMLAPPIMIPIHPITTTMESRTFHQSRRQLYLSYINPIARILRSISTENRTKKATSSTFATSDSVEGSLASTMQFIMIIDRINRSNQIFKITCSRNIRNGLVTFMHRKELFANDLNGKLLDC